MGKTIEEGLFVDFPGQSSRGKQAPTVVLRKTTGTVVTHGKSQKIALFEGIIHTTKERNQVVLSNELRILYQHKGMLLILIATGIVAAFPLKMLPGITGSQVNAAVDALYIFHIVQIKVEQVVLIGSRVVGQTSPGGVGQYRRRSNGTIVVPFTL